MSSLSDLTDRIKQFFGNVSQSAAPVAQNIAKYAPQALQAVSNPVSAIASQVAKQPQVQQLPQQAIKTYQQVRPNAAEAFNSARSFLDKAPIIGDIRKFNRDNLGPSWLTQVTQEKDRNQQANLISQALGAGTIGKPRVTSAIISPTKASWLDQGLNRARNVIAKQGPAGEEIARKLQAARDLAETTAGGWVSKLPTVGKLSKGEFENFVDVAEGKAKPLSDMVTDAVAEWGKVRDEVYHTAQASGLDIGRLENYFPHRFDPKMFEGDSFVKAVTHLVETGQAKSTEEAATLLRNAQDTIRDRRQGNLEVERMVDLPGYEKTKDALFGYLDSASNRIAQVKHFGHNDDIAMQLINRIGQEGGDASTAKSLFDTSVGAKKYGETQKQISGMLRGLNSTTKLGLGAITNIGQSVNTATVTGGLRTLLNAPKAAFSKESKDFALKAGITLDSVLNDLREGSGLSGALGKIGAPGFNVVEKFNRTLAATAGRDYARSLAAKGDAKTLAKMGIQLVGKSLTPEQEIQAARNIVERTQFKVDPQDLPGWTSSPWGKVLTQFKSFSYNQTAFLGREIIQPAMHGNMAPLTRFLAIGIPVGMGLQTVKNILRNRQDEENPVKKVQQGLSQVGGFGLAGDVLTGLFPMNGKYLDSNRATTMALSTLGGPTVGTAMEGYGSLANAIQGKPENLERFAIKQIPVVGSTLQNTFLPYKSAGGEENRRFGNTSVAMASEGSNSKSTLDIALTPIEQAKVKDQITKLHAKEKEILADNGTFGFGGRSNEEKNTQLLEIDNQINTLEEQLKTPEQRLSKEKELADVQYSYLAENLKRSGDYKGWTDATTGYVKYLEDFKTKTKDQADQIRLQNKIDDLKVSLAKYGGYGGFKKGKNPAKISIKTTKSAINKSTIRKSVIHAPGFKLKKTPTFKLSKPKTSTLKLSTGRYQAQGPTLKFKNSLTS